MRTIAVKFKWKGRSSDMRNSPRYSNAAVAAAVLVLCCFTNNWLNTCCAAEPLVTNRDSISIEMRKVLDDEFMQMYSRAVDTVDGGFFSDMNYQWDLDGKQDKMIVTQARYVWAASNAAMFYQKDNTLRDIASHGVKFLREKMWDSTFGGFFNLVSREGEPLNEGGGIVKQAYGNAFAIYGLAAYYRASGDTAALMLAQKAFRWLDSHSYDSRYGGYFQFMSRDGTPMEEGYRGVPPKDQNSMIHLLESFTELYSVWPDSVVRERLSSMLHLIRDTVVTEKGYLRLFFKRDWSPIVYPQSKGAVNQREFEFDHVSFGHDVETAYLMREASKALHLKNDTLTLMIGKKMVDRAILNGWDTSHGGIFDGGYYFDGDDHATIVRRTKEWWGQAEALNSFLLMSELFPEDTLHYYEKFCVQWKFCKDYVIDMKRGGWFWGGTDIVPNLDHSPKASIWKCNYHTSRAMINCIERIERETLPREHVPYEPVNPHATLAARKLLTYLYSIQGKKIISGNQNYVGRFDTYPDIVKELTGKLPEVWGCDFINYYVPGYAQALVDEAYKKYTEGYIITLMWHAGRPQDDPPFKWKEGIQGKMTSAEWTELTTPGTRLNARWMAQVDTVAKYLGELQDLGVPVLWRPYHESNGVWFWWGNKRGEDGFAKLYRMMYDRYVNYHKLNNLIWVWNTNAPRQLIDDEAYEYKEYFPGMECVDVFATDVYHNDYRQSHHDELVRLGRGKIIALGEVGEVPTPEILDRQPMWTWFMVWGNFVITHNTPEQMRALYNYPGTLSHEDFLPGK
ncbi:MAG TPA: glycosyl hydrolase [Bacteroidota bacterium]|nr:glycosyl hydrolase [Bacteroidota bacterium]